MEIGQQYKHAFLAALTCTVVSHTARGCKVFETDRRGRKVKTKQAFYDKADFVGGNAFWSKK